MYGRPGVALPGVNTHVVRGAFAPGLSLERVRDEGCADGWLGTQIEILDNIGYMYASLSDLNAESEYEGQGMQQKGDTQTCTWGEVHAGKFTDLDHHLL